MLFELRGLEVSISRKRRMSLQAKQLVDVPESLCSGGMKRGLGRGRVLQISSEMWPQRKISTSRSRQG